MYRRYIAILVCAYVACATAIFGATLWLEPLSGDLTRLGGYGERDFGWNDVQHRFVPSLVLPQQDARHADIVVIGDSFSSRTTPDRQTPEGGFWTDYLAQATGLAVRVQAIDAMSIEQFVASSGFRATPPRVVIAEFAARTLRDRMGQGDGTCTSVVAQVSLALPLRPTEDRPIAFRRSDLPRYTAPLDAAADFIRKRLTRSVFGGDSGPVQRMELDRDDLFSNRAPKALLVYKEDFARALWSSSDWQRIRCAAIQWHNLVEANGRTAFVLAIVPDKSFVYASAMRGVPVLRPASSAFIGLSALRIPPLEPAFERAVSSGRRDLYLPDDTHWGSAGSELAAQVVAACLAGECARRDVGQLAAGGMSGGQ